MLWPALTTVLKIPGEKFPAREVLYERKGLR